MHARHPSSDLIAADTQVGRQMLTRQAARGQRRGAQRSAPDITVTEPREDSLVRQSTEALFATARPIGEETSSLLTSSTSASGSQVSSIEPSQIPCSQRQELLSTSLLRVEMTREDTSPPSQPQGAMAMSSPRIRSTSVVELQRHLELAMTNQGNTTDLSPIPDQYTALLHPTLGLIVNNY